MVSFIILLITNLIVYAEITFTSKDVGLIISFTFEIILYGLIGPSIGIALIVLSNHEDKLNFLHSRTNKKRFSHLAIQINSYSFTIGSNDKEALLVNGKNYFYFSSIVSLNRVDNVITLVNNDNMFSLFFKTKEEAKVVYEHFKVRLDID